MSLLSNLTPMTKERLELLRMAKEMLFNEYIDRKAQLHNTWLTEADVAWKTRRVRIPYPAFPPYPDNEIIIAKAIQLERFLSSQEKEETPVENKQPEVQVQVETVEPKIIETKTVEEVKEEKVSSIVPTILEENAYFKNGEDSKEILADKPSLLPNWFARK
jgi:hypothetical protein